MKNTIPSIAISGLLTITSQAAVLVDWDFTGLTNPTTEGNEVTYDTSNDADAATYATTVSNVTAGNIDTGSSAIYTRTLGWSPGNPVTGELNLQNWDLTGTAGSSGTTGSAGDGTADNWIQFSLTAGAGYEMTVTEIDLSAWRNGSGAAEDFTWGYSTDGGTSWTQFGSTYTETNGGDSVFRDTNYTDNVTASDLLIRFAPTGGSGNIHIDGISVTGEVNAIPEPSSAALLGLSGLALILRRRK
ncbi:PEP-CTERM sorting domain-containing protein [Verrucomicrobiaceae bacterium 5K15]|uniref:PEP-CTERM sorting domain-containing protein n=1 Tax=Oceaniferula flava TaxID=2800421 RepID=A0AAE2V997_9BACT|nr:PEP-CTERM sorting domain-containing protein [Oceaniferula flavus]MBK1854773.1 PEP-CTERM sorting domain-containing protein [Oceaniferula flavus]MBM1136079.1 PEP-CTERM sorting domain-containing protein [Oceaniferula flavus]